MTSVEDTVAAVRNFESGRVAFGVCPTENRLMPLHTHERLGELVISCPRHGESFAFVDVRWLTRDDARKAGWEITIPPPTNTPN